MKKPSAPAAPAPVMLDVVDTSLQLRNPGVPETQASDKAPAPAPAAPVMRAWKKPPVPPRPAMKEPAAQASTAPSPSVDVPPMAPSRVDGSVARSKPPPLPKKRERSTQTIRLARAPAPAPPVEEVEAGLEVELVEVTAVGDAPPEGIREVRASRPSLPRPPEVPSRNEALVKPRPEAAVPPAATSTQAPAPAHSPEVAGAPAATSTQAPAPAHSPEIAVALAATSAQAPALRPEAASEEPETGAAIAPPAATSTQAPALTPEAASEEPEMGAAIAPPAATSTPAPAPTPEAAFELDYAVLKPGPVVLARAVWFFGVFVTTGAFRWMVEKLSPVGVWLAAEWRRAVTRAKATRQW